MTPKLEHHFISKTQINRKSRFANWLLRITSLLGIPNRPEVSPELNNLSHTFLGEAPLAGAKAQARKPRKVTKVT